MHKPSYQKSTTNARRKREPIRKKKKKKVNENDVLRLASQIGASEEHISAGLGVVQHSDTEELHRNYRRRASTIDSMEKVGSTLLTMPHNKVQMEDISTRRPSRRRKSLGGKGTGKTWGSPTKQSKGKKGASENAAMQDKRRQMRTSQKLDALSGRANYSRPASPPVFPRSDIDDASWTLDPGESPTHYERGGASQRWAQDEDEEEGGVDTEVDTQKSEARRKRMDSLKLAQDMRRHQRAGLRADGASQADVMAYHLERAEKPNKKFGTPSNVADFEMKHDLSLLTSSPNPRPATTTSSPKRRSDMAGGRANASDSKAYQQRHGTAYQPRVDTSPKRMAGGETQWAEASPTAKKTREGDKLQRQARYASHQAATPVPKKNKLKLKLKKKTKGSSGKKKKKGAMNKKKRKKKLEVEAKLKAMKEKQEKELKLPAVQPEPELASAGRSLLQSYVPRRDMPDYNPGSPRRTRFPAAKPSQHCLYPQRNRMHHMLFLL